MGLFAAEIMVARAGTAAGTADQTRPARRAARSGVEMPGKIDLDGPRSLCRISDLSPAGARLITYAPLEQHAVIMLTLPDQPARLARIVWADDFEAGCAFDEPLDDLALKALVSRYGFSPALPEVAIFRGAS